MALVNCRVRNCTSNKTVFTWSIMSVEGGVTVQQFYDDVCKPPEHEEVPLDSAGLGKSKDSLDTIEMLLSLESAVQLFGAFLRYNVCSEQYQVAPVHDAFALLMTGQKHLSQAGLPARVPVRTKKDKLHNDFVAFLGTP